VYFDLIHLKGKRDPVRVPFAWFAGNVLFLNRCWGDASERDNYENTKSAKMEEGNKFFSAKSSSYTPILNPFRVFRSLKVSVFLAGFAE